MLVTSEIQESSQVARYHSDIRWQRVQSLQSAWQLLCRHFSRECPSEVRV